MATAYGLTSLGFINKRLSDILTEKRAKAVQLFQDQTAVGDVVDTSDSSILGRLIALDAAGESLLWEQMQDLYGAFDPNTATGISLDNLVALGGITRLGSSFSTAQVILAGDNGTLVASGLTIGSTVDSSQWTLLSPVALSPTSATGATFSPLVVADNTLYTITYSSISTSNSINYTSGTGATAATIVAGIAALVGTSHPTLTATVVGSVVTLVRVDEFAVVSFTTTSNLGITKVQKIGEVQSTVSGPVDAEVNSLSKILTPQLGWDSVYNPTAASPGRNLETDDELRLRFRETKFERASNILEALYSSLISLDGVQEVRIYENDTDTTDSLGVPAHSFMPIVLGGLSSDIAESIWENKPMGIRSYGDTVVVIYDNQGVDGGQGFAHNIGFERPDPVPLYITMTLETDSNFPATGKDDIASALVAYIGTLGIGDDVIYSRLYTPINSVAGFQVDSLFVGTSPSPTGTGPTIPIAFNQIASISSVNIVINT